MPKLPDGHVVCGLCKEIIPKEKSKQYVKYYSWGSFSGTPSFDVCCDSHELNDSKEPQGEYKRAYC